MIDEPKNDGDHNTDEQSRAKRNVEREILPLDQDIAWQLPQAQTTEPGPQQSRGKYGESDNDQGA